MITVVGPLFAAGVYYGNEDSSEISYARCFHLLRRTLPVVTYSC